MTQTTPSTSAQWKLVPVEPTIEMMASQTGYTAEGLRNEPLRQRDLKLKYAAMLAASPSPAASPASPSEVRTGAEMIAHHRFRLADDGNCAEIDSGGLAEEIDAALASLASDATPAPTSGAEAGDAVVFPSYGEMDWSDLAAAVSNAIYDEDCLVLLDPDTYPGHQMVRPINFNSLNRIVTWFVKRALAKPASEPAGGDVRENNLARCPSCGAPEGMDCRTVQGCIPPCHARAALSSSAGPAEPVAWSDCWRVRAHGNWLYFTDEETAFGSAEMHGTVAQPLYAHPAPATVEMLEACTDCGGTGVTFQTERRCACQPRQDAVIGAVAALSAAISLLERTPKAKKAAPSDRMFDQMLADYRKALNEVRAALAPATEGRKS